MGLTVWTRELFQCWGLAEKDDRAARPDECVFCKKIAEADPNAFVYQDAELVVFKDWKPAARQHLLVVPRKHITSARVLTGGGRRPRETHAGSGKESSRRRGG